MPHRVIRSGYVIRSLSLKRSTSPSQYRRSKCGLRAGAVADGLLQFLRKIGNWFLAQGETAVGLRKQFRPFYKAMFVHSASAVHFKD